MTNAAPFGGTPKTTKEADLAAWQEYKRTRSPQARSALLKRFTGVIQSQVNKWVGPIPREVLSNEAALLACKAFDTYNPQKGTALSTHVINNLAPLSRLVYTHQNVARLPENQTLKLRNYQDAKERLTTLNGYSPTTDELHQELGWSVNELNRIENSMRNDLVESVGGLNDNFYSDKEDVEADLLSSLYFSLSPEEKTLFEYRTGYNGKPRLSNPEIMKRTGLSQAQLSYKITLLSRKLNQLKGRFSHAR